VVAHCANPKCRAPFRYLSGGRLFHFDFRSPDPSRSSRRLQVEHFWLCSKCALTLTLTVDGESVLTAQQKNK